LYTILFVALGEGRMPDYSYYEELEEEAFEEKNKPKRKPKKQKKNWKDLKDEYKRNKKTGRLYQSNHPDRI
jgi:hypothetical protein